MTSSEWVMPAFGTILVIMWVFFGLYLVFGMLVAHNVITGKFLNRLVGTKGFFISSMNGDAYHEEPYWLPFFMTFLVLGTIGWLIQLFMAE